MAFDIVAAYAADAPFYVSGQSAAATLHEAPQQLTLKFSPGVKIDPSSLGSIQVWRSGGAADAFGNANDEIVTTGSISVDDLPNENQVVLRFADTLPDDSYQIRIGGGLQTNPSLSAEPQNFRDGKAFNLDFRLNLGAFVKSVVPQPIARAKTLSINANTALINDGDLLEVSLRGGTLIFEFDRDGKTSPDNTALAIGTKTAADLATEIASEVTAASAVIGSAFFGELSTATAVTATVTITGATFTPGVKFTRGGSAPASPPVTVGDGGLSQARDRVVVYFNADDPLDPVTASDVRNYQLLETDPATGADLAVNVPTSVSYDATSATTVLSFAAGAVADAKLYRLRIGNATDDNHTDVKAVNVGTVFQQATPGTPGYTTTAFLGEKSANDVDLYKVSLPAAAGIKVTVTPDASLDAIVRLFDSTGTEVAITGAGTGAGAQDVLGFVGLAAGTYYIGVSSKGNGAYLTDGTGAVDGTTTGSYKLDIESTLTMSASDTNSSFGTSTTLGVLGVAGATVSASINVRPTVPTPAGSLQFQTQPGTLDEPGHRDIPVNSRSEQHGLPASTLAPAAAITVQEYNFQSYYGDDPQGNPLFNAITETQKQRAREVFDLYSRFSGIRFVETAASGITVVTGDMRAINPNITTAPSGLAEDGGRAIMDSTDNWGSSEYGGAWFRVAMHEIGHALGLHHSYDIPSILGNGLTGEPVFPGDYDIEHATMLYPKTGSDIDVYDFTLESDGRLSAETVVARPGAVITSTLDTVLTLYRETSGGKREMIARNDDFYGRDSFIGLDLAAGKYFLVVTSTGNTNFNAEVEDSGNGGRTDGGYQLKLGFSPTTADGATITDATPPPTESDRSVSQFDGDRDGLPGGAFDFWFKSAAPDNTIYVDKLGTTLVRSGTFTNGSTTVTFANNADVVGLVSGMKVVGTGIPTGTRITNIVGTTITLSQATTRAASGMSLTFGGTLASPFTTVDAAIKSAGSGSIIRIVGNASHAAYLVGSDPLGAALPDGATLNVPAGVTVMVDEGAVFKLRSAVIDVGSSSQIVSRAGAALQVLGTPGGKVIFTSYHDDSVGTPLGTPGKPSGDDDVGPPAQGGQWGGVVLRQDSDVASKQAFVNSISNASFRYGGGQVVVDSKLQSFTPIHLESTRPTLAFNQVTNSAGAAISADPNSFENSNGRVGPELRGNFLDNNSVNGMFIRIKTTAGNGISKLTVPARFRSRDITYVIAENLVIDGGAGGYIRDQVTGNVTARPVGQLTIDPGVIVKLQGSRIELERGGSQLLAEGDSGARVIFTSLSDNRFGAGGTFNTNGDQPNKFDAFGRPIDTSGTLITAPTTGDWGGIILNAGSRASIDHAYLAFGGGSTPIEGGFDRFNVIETQQGDLRLTNSRLENNDYGLATTNRTGRQGNAAATVFVRGAQPIVVGNDFRNNIGRPGADNAAISINANSLSDLLVPDPGRSTGPLSRFTQYDVNMGPLVRDNTMSYQTGQYAVVGMAVRGEEITVEGAWDDIDIVHVVRNEIIVNNFHTATGLRLLSATNASLVVKLLGPNAGFTASGVPLEINDRIGGTVQVIGQPGYPVVLTSLKDDLVGASLDPLGVVQKDTFTDGATLGSPGDWRSLKFLPLSNDRNVAILQESEKPNTGGLDKNGDVLSAQPLGTLAPNYPVGTNTSESAQEKSGDENRRLGFEVHGSVAIDTPSDADVYSFTGYAGSQIWIDVDKTSPSLDAMVELLDASGKVLARSADSQNDTAIVKGENAATAAGASVTVDGVNAAVSGVAAVANGVAAQVVGATSTVAGVAAQANGASALVAGAFASATGTAAQATGTAALVRGATTQVEGVGAKITGASIKVIGVATKVTAAVTSGFTVAVADGSIARAGVTVNAITGVPAGTLVVNRSGTTVTLSKAVTLAADSLISFGFSGNTSATSKIMVVEDVSMVTPGVIANGIAGVPSATTVATFEDVLNSVEFTQAVTAASGNIIRLGFASTDIVVDDAAGIATGAAVTGAGVAPGTTVASVSGTTITLDTAVDVADGQFVTFALSASVTTSRVVVADVTGISTNVKVNGVAGIPTGTTVTSIDALSKTVTLSQPVTVANTDTIGFGFRGTMVTLDTNAPAIAEDTALVTVNGAAVGVRVANTSGDKVTFNSAVDVANGDSIGFTFVGAGSLTTSRVRVDDATVATVGATVSINGVPQAGILVSNVDVTSKTVTFSGPMTVANSDFIGFSFIGGASIATTRVVLDSVTGISNGVKVNGVPGVLAGTTVTNVDPTSKTVTLSQAATVANADTLGFGFQGATVTLDTTAAGVASLGTAVTVNGVIQPGITVDSVLGNDVTFTGSVNVANSDYLGFAFGAGSLTTSRVRVDDATVATVGATVYINGGDSGRTVTDSDVASGAVTLSGTVTVANNDFIGFSFVGVGSIATTRVVLDDVSNVIDGVLVNGVTGIPAGTIVTNVDPNSKTVTLSSRSTVANGNTLGFGFNAATVTLDTAAAGVATVGAAVTVNGAIQAGITVASVSGNDVTLSGSVDVANRDYLGFAFVGAGSLLANRVRVDDASVATVGAAVFINGVDSGRTVSSSDVPSGTVTLSGTVTVANNDFIGFSFIGAASIATTRVVLADLTGINVGVKVNGVPGVVAGTTVSSIDATSKTVTLSQAATVANADLLGFGFKGTTITVQSVAGVDIGVTVAGVGVPAGTTVVAIDGVNNTLTLSQAIDVEDAATLRFDRQRYQLANGNVLPGTLSGVIYQGNTAIQTFTVDAQGLFTFTPIGNPVSRVVTASLDAVTGLVRFDFDVVPATSTSIEASYDFGRLSLDTLGFSLAGANGALPMEKDAYRGGDFYSQNPRDPGMRVVLPGVTGVATQYFVRVRSQPKQDAATLGQFAGATRGERYDSSLKSTTFNEADDPAAGQTSGRYELRIRERQQDEKPGSTVQYADIRFPTIGIDVQGLPRNSQLVGETGEVPNPTSAAADNASFATAQQIGNLLAVDRNTISVAGTMASAADVDWYTFTLDYRQIQSIGGVNGGTKTWATIFDIDYADGFRGDLTMSVFDASGALIYVGRDSNIADDQPAAGQGNDFDDLSRGSLGKLDPYIGNVQMPAGGPGSTTSYYVAISSNERLPNALNATFQSGALNALIRLEPVTSLKRIVEDHIGWTGNPTLFTDIQPVTPAIIDTTNLATNVRPFTLSDVTLFVSTGSSLYTVDASRGTGWETIIANATYTNGSVGDIDMRTDGRLFQYFGAFSDADNTGLLREIETATGGILSSAGDGISDDPTTPTFWQVTGGSPDAVAIRRTDVAQYVDQVYYAIRDGGNSYLYRARTSGNAAFAQNEPFSRIGATSGLNGTNGVAVTGAVTGLQFQNDVGPLYGVSSGGQFFDVNTASGAPGTVIDFSQYLANNTYGTFQGLTSAPVNLEGGRYAGMFFAITSTGRLLCIDPASGQLLDNVFDTNSDGYADSEISNAMFGGGVTGLAFSPLDINLWHTTGLRRNDAGHGVNFAPDNTRLGRTLGGSSMYFGLEEYDPQVGQQFGVNAGIPYLWQQDLTAGSNSIGNNYNLPGGAYGSLVTNTFSLAGYGSTDKPTLYFNYFLDTEKASSLTDNMRDSARVFASIDNGLTWRLLATNNEARPILDSFGGELPNTSSVSSSIGDDPNQRVQELFDSTGTWRQARVDLGDFAGRSNIRLRFDFSTAGELDAGDRSTLAIDAVRTVVVAPAPADLATVTLDSTDGLEVGMFMKLRAAGPDRFVTQTTTTVASANVFTVTVASATGLTQGMAVSGRNIPAGTTIASIAGTTLTLTRRVTLAANTALSFTRVDAATTIVSIDPTTNEIVLSSLVSLIATDVLNFYRPTAALLNDIRDSANVFGNFRGTDASRERGSNNDFEGFYIDDIIVGFAERGEMVTGANPNETAVTFSPNTPVSFSYHEQVLQGTYQLELRRGTEYAGQPSPSLSEANINRVFDTNDRLVQSSADPTLVLERNGFEAIAGAVASLGNGNTFASPIFGTLGATEGMNAIVMAGNGGSATANNAVTWAVDLANQPQAFLTFRYATGTSETVTQLPASFSLANNNGIPSGDGVAVSTDGGTTWKTVFDFGNTELTWKSVRLDLVSTAGPLSAQTVIGFFRSGTLTVANNGGIAIDDAVITVAPPTANIGLVGDSNLPREQGQFLIMNNIVTDASTFGISIDAGNRDGGSNIPHPGVARNLPTLNNARLAPGVVVANNVVAYSGTAGILFSGDGTTTNVPLAVVPYGRIINNTLVGSVAGGAPPTGTGVQVTDNAAPTLLNNLFANLAAGIAVDQTSDDSAAGPGMRAVVGYSAFYNTSTEVSASLGSFAATESMTLFSDPFVNASRRNFYLAERSQAIDSSIDVLQDRNSIVVVNSPLGIPESPVLAPAYDLYGQLRADDPLVANTSSGLGLNVFKDRGAIDRIDQTKPTVALLVPIDNGPDDNDSTNPDTIQLVKSAARGVTQFILQLNDVGVGIDKSTVVSGAFVLTRNGVPHVEGVDYLFRYLESNNQVILESASVYDYGSYVVTVRTPEATAQIADLAGNTLSPNKSDGSTSFAISLADVPGTPTGLVAKSLDGSVEVSWTAPEDNSSPLIEYVVQTSSDGVTWTPAGDAAKTGSTATTKVVTGLTNGTTYQVRVAAINAIGQSQDYAVITATPLAAPTVVLASDTGFSNTDGLTNNGTVNVGLFLNASWEYSIDSGANWTAGTGTSFVLLPGVFNPGVVQVRQTYPLGSANTSIPGSNAIAFVVDTTAPTVAIVSDKSALKAGATATITFTLSESSTTFGDSDVAVSGGTLSSIAGSGTVYTAIFTPASSPTAVGQISVAAGTFTDTAGNPNLAGAMTPDLVIDTVAPTVSITSDKAALKAGETAAIIFTLSEPSSNFTVDDLTLIDGTVTNFTRVSSTVYTATFTPTPDKLAYVQVQVLASKFTDAAGNGNLFNRWFVLSDTVRPTVAITSNKTALKAGETAAITFTLSEPSTDFTADDLTLIDGTVTNFRKLSGTVYTATFTPTPDKLAYVQVQVLASKFTDAAGNGNLFNRWFVLSDTVRPTVAITSDKAALKAGETAAITFTLSKPSTDFTADDLTLIDGTVTRFTKVSSTVYTATFTPTPDKLAYVQVQVLASKFTDAAGNGNLFNRWFVLSDTVRPTIAIASDKTALKAGETAAITFTLSKPSTDFTADDLTLIDGTVTNFRKRSGTVYTATFTPTPDKLAYVQVQVLASKFTDAAGNGNLFNRWFVLSDTVRPTVAITSDKAALKAGETTRITFRLSKPSTNFSLNDVTSSGGTLSGFAGSGTAYSAIFRPTANSTATGSVSVAVSVFTDSVGNGNTPGSLSTAIRIDTAVPTVSITSDKTALKAGETAAITVTLSEASTDFTADDLTVIDGTITNFVKVSSTVYTATFTPTPDKLAYVQVQVPANKFTDAAGNGNLFNRWFVLSDTVRPTVAITSDKAALKAGETTKITFRLSKPSTDFTLNDVTSSGGTLSGFAGSGQAYSAIFTPTANSTVTGSVSVDASVFTDSVGNANTPGSLSTAIRIDTVVPTVSITSDKAALKAGETAAITFTLSEASSNFTVDDLTLIDGTVTNFVWVSSTVYTATFTPTPDKIAYVQVQVPAGKFTDAAGNGNLFNRWFVLSDTLRPVVSVFASSTASGSYGAGIDIGITANVSKPVQAGSTLNVTLSTGRVITLSALSQGTVLTGTYRVLQGDNAGRLSVRSYTAGTVTDLAGNYITSTALPVNNISTVIAIDTIAPVIVGFSSPLANGIYRTGAVIPLTATLSEDVRAGGEIRVILNTGAIVTLIAATQGRTLTGNYTVTPGDASSDLDVISFQLTGNLLIDAAGNNLTSTALPTGSGQLAVAKQLVIDASVSVTSAGFSMDPNVIPKKGTVTAVPITFSTPVTGVSLAAFRLYLNNRSLSLSGASITGSGASYTLRLPTTLTGTRGVYRLEILPTVGIAATVNGAPMQQTAQIFWSNGV